MPTACLSTKWSKFSELPLALLDTPLDALSRLPDLWLPVKDFSAPTCRWACSLAVSWMTPAK